MADPCGDKRQRVNTLRKRWVYWRDERKRSARRSAMLVFLKPPLQQAERKLKKCEREAVPVWQQLGRDIVKLSDQGKVTHPLQLSTGGTSRRDFEQLAREGRVKVGATGQTRTPNSKAQIQLLRAIIRAANNGGCPVNAYAGGVHRSGSKHYSLEAFDAAENRGNVASAVRTEGGYFFDEDPYHDHYWFGSNGP